MRAAALLLIAALAAAPAIAQQPAAAPPADSEVMALRQQLLASQQQIATLRRELADQTSRASALDTCRARNARLVSIGNELVDAYGKRYRSGHRDPFQFGRRRLEAEMEEKSEAIYDNRSDVPTPASAPAGRAGKDDKQ